MNPRRGLDGAGSYTKSLRACLSVRFQGFTPTPQYRPSASSRLWPARPAALCLPDPCGLGSDSHGDKAFSGKLLEFLTQTGSKRKRWASWTTWAPPASLCLSPLAESWDTVSAVWHRLG